MKNLFRTNRIRQVCLLIFIPALLLTPSLVHAIGSRRSAIRDAAETPDGWQQQRTVSGIVRDDAGLVLQGASVVVKETSIGTVSDAAGRYSLNYRMRTISLLFPFQDIPPGRSM